MFVDAAVDLLEAFRELESGILDVQADVDTLEEEMAMTKRPGPLTRAQASTCCDIPALVRSCHGQAHAQRSCTCLSVARSMLLRRDSYATTRTRHMGRHILCILALMASLASTACPSHPRGSAQVVLTWDYTEPTPPIEGFLVQRRMGTGPWQEVVRVGATVLTVTDATAPRNTLLCYQVLAYRGQEQSLPSNEVCLTIPAATRSSAHTRPEGRLATNGLSILHT